MEIQFQLFFYIFISVFCAPPPKPKPPYEIFVKEPILVTNSNSSLKNLEETGEQFVEKSNAIIYLLGNGLNETHEIKLSTKNLDDYSSFREYSFYIKLSEGETLELKSNICYKSKLSGGELTEKDECIPSFNKNGEKYTFTYNYILNKNEYITINYNYIITRATTEKLFKQESISIPDLYPKGWCTYKFIVPDIYLDLGLDRNYLTKEKNNIYVYNSSCPIYRKDDVIRFTPTESYWKADVEVYIEASGGLSDDVSFKIPRYYKGGKNRNKNYKITSLVDDSLLSISPKEEVFLGVKVPGKKKKKVGFNLHTAFANKMDGDFLVYTSDNYYKLNNNIYDKIKNKAQSVITDESEEYKNLPNYYKIGKFVYSYMKYDYDCVGKELSLKQIFEGRKGVCEHFTLLYNAMLNSIGINAIYVMGWAFADEEDIYVDEDVTGHAWSVALIDGKWKELDATWGLFEGIPAGHILKGLGQDLYSFKYSEGFKPFNFKNIKVNDLESRPFLELVDNIDDEDTVESEEINISKYAKIYLLKYAFLLIFSLF